MNSLWRQLIIALLAAFVVLLGIGGSFVFWSVEHSLYDQFDASLRSKALMIVGNTQLSNSKIHVNFTDRVLREFDKEVSLDFFQVFTSDGRPIASSSGLQNWSLPYSLHGPLSDPTFWNLTLRSGDPGRGLGDPGRAIGIVFQPHMGKNDTKQDVILVVASNRLALVENLRKLRNILFGCGATLVLLTALVVPWVLRRNLRPLNDLADHATHIEAESLGQPFPVESLPSELRPIANRLNDLLLRLEASFERERRFGSDIAHELRTPLAELRAMAEVALKWPQERASDLDRSVLEISIQMESLVNRLLTLTRAEQGRVLIKPEKVDLNVLLDGILKPITDKITQRCLTIERTIPPASLFETDPVLFRSIIANLVENAVEYSPPSDRVTLLFQSDAAGYCFQVSNRAPNLHADDLPRMFDRLWRKDVARADVTHTGLGLAMSRSFTQLLGLKLEPSLDRTNRLTMALTSSEKSGS